MLTLSHLDRDAIEQARRAFWDAVNADNLDRMFMGMTDDLQAFPPNQPADLTKAAHRRTHEQRIAQFTTRIDVSPSELVGGGDVVFDRFAYRIALTPRAGGAEIRDTGNCVWLWRRETGSWKLARAIWNSDQPIAVVA